MAGERLVVFAKAPVPGRVKTRLAGALGEAGAARLYTAFVSDVLRRLEADRERILYHQPEQPDPWLSRIATSRRMGLRPQRGHDLGERLQNAFVDARDDGVGRTVVIGCDSPDLPAKRIEQAFASLESSDLVLGPAVDGGYYLIGSRAVPTVFSDIQWGTSTVLRATIERATRLGLIVRSLEPWYDVDRPADLEFLRCHLDLLNLGGENRCPETSRELAAAFAV